MKQSLSDMPDQLPALASAGGNAGISPTGKWVLEQKISRNPDVSSLIPNN